MKEKGRFLKKYRDTTKKLSFKDFFNEFFASIFSYDSRLTNTIITLLFKPGFVSKEYIEGKRVRYANPFRFYLSVSILFFIVSGLFIDFDTLISKSGDEEKDKNKKEFITINSDDEDPKTLKDSVPVKTKKHIYFSKIVGKRINLIIKKQNKSILQSL